jgi:hypothetical protein
MLAPRRCLFAPRRTRSGTRSSRTRDWTSTLPENPNTTSKNDVVGCFRGGGHNGANNKIVDSCLSATVRPGLLFAVTSGGDSLVLENVIQNQPPTFVDVAPETSV